MIAMRKTTERVLRDDPQAAAFLNEVKVVMSLARTNNEKNYVAKIADLPPKIKTIQCEEVEATKPGTKASCLRLEKAGILKSESASAPKRGHRGTPHFSIAPSLDAFYLIMDRLGMGVLDEVRSSGFGASVITADINRYLAKQLGVALERVEERRSQLETVVFFARHSTKALTVLLTYARPAAKTPRESRNFDLGNAMIRLRDSSHLAFLLDRMTAIDQDGFKGMRIASSISSEIGYGELAFTLTSNIGGDSDESGE